MARDADIKDIYIPRNQVASFLSCYPTQTVSIMKDIHLDSCFEYNDRVNLDKDEVMRDVSTPRSADHTFAFHSLPLYL